MKIESKKITVEKEVYIAEDGSEFDYEEDCEAYEISLIGKRLNLYDYNFKKVARIEDTFYAKLNGWGDVEAFVRLADFDGISSKGIEGPGIYVYVEGTYGRGKVAWFNLLETVNKIEEVANDSCSQ